MAFISRLSPPSIFPTYLLPSLPFSRRKTSTDSTSSTETEDSVETPNASPSPLPSAYLSGHTSYLRCGRCGTDLCFTSQVISKGFTGRHGRAYLVSASTSAHGHSRNDSYEVPPSLPNTHVHKVVPRQLVTGAHTVSDVSCAFCGNMLGWKYVDAEEESQRYKVGKFILETKKICTAVSWDDAKGASGKLPPFDTEAENSIEFDSQDEDECEDLFAGLWSPSSALKRRRLKRFGRQGSR
ncbi:hypothetical protein MMC34_007365 [Xylographa carneopallida]|nr:hypothetical protein [Xylographa carneopallida]